MLRDYLQPVAAEMACLLDFSAVFADFEHRWAVIKDSHDFVGIGWHRFPGINALFEEGVQTADLMKSRLATLNDSVLYPDVESILVCFSGISYDRNLAHSLVYDQTSPIYDVQEQLVNLYCTQNEQINAVYSVLRELKVSPLYAAELQAQQYVPTRRAA
jgi:hypothetical protein